MVVKRRFLFIPVVVFSLFLFSCGQEGPFMPVSNMEDAVTLGISVQPGRIVDPAAEENIGITMTYDDNRVLPEKLEVALLDSNGNVVGTPAVIEGDDLKKELPPIDTTSLEDGLYKIRLRVYDSDGQLIKETVTPFFDSRIKIQIEGIDVYPPEFAPGSSGLVFPKVDAPDTVWVRWSLGDTIISEGTLGSYATGLVWNAPREEGVYTLKMEVFPFAPPSTSSYSFPSSLFTNVQIFVTNAVSPNTYDLSPGSSYTMLLNLNGNISDEGAFHNSTEQIGDPSLILDDGGFGYLFHKGDGITVDADTLPVSGGYLSPFSATFRFKITDVQTERNFLKINNAGGDTLFAVETDVSGIFTAILKQSSEPDIEDSSGIDSRSAAEVTLSVVPSGNTVVFLWYADGKLVKSDSFGYTPLELSGTPQGSTVLGGKEGFEGFIDYAGIYFRDSDGRLSTDDDIYRRFIMRSGNAESADFIEGFDGLSIPDKIAALNTGNTGISVSGGNLVIAPGSSAVIMESGSEFTGMSLAAETESGQDGAVFLFSVERKGKNIETAEVKFSKRSSTSRFKAVLRSNILKISSGGTLEAQVKFLEGDVLRVSIKNGNSVEPVKISSLLVSRDVKQIVEKKTNGRKNSL